MSFPTASAAVRTAYQLAFEFSPIILVGGSFANSPGGLMPIVALFGQLAGFLQGAASNGTVFDTSNFIARYQVMNSGKVIDYDYGKYPYANQQTAANAAIKKPLNFSIAPVNRIAGYLSKTLIISSAINDLKKHIDAGGYFIVLTPGYIYQDCLLKGMTDISPESDKQKQIIWQLDFEQPLITQTQAQVAQNQLIQKLTSGAKFIPPTFF
jgi:hypothetical protein